MERLGKSVEGIRTEKSESSAVFNALTIDLEDWYQGLTSTSPKVNEWPRFEDRVVENTERLLSIFADSGVKATFFVLGYVAEQFPDLIRKVARNGHEIGLHGYYHRRVTTLTPTQFRDDVEMGMSAIIKAIGNRVSGFRAPMFSINGSSRWALKTLDEMGFSYDSSVYPVRNRWYGYPEASRFPFRPIEGSDFLEFPLTTLRTLGINLPIAGGFYLRALPYKVFRWALTRVNEEGKPAILYLHPWELDTTQPPGNPTLRERFTHFYNRSSVESKLKDLIQDFRFGPISLLMNGTDQNC